MNIVLDCKEAIEINRTRALNMDSRGMTNVELNALQEFQNAVEKALKQRQAPLDRTCNSCIMHVLRSLKNYIEYYEPKNDEEPVEITEEIGLEVEVELELDEETLRGMKLKELRNLYPDIKATSVNDFVDKLINGDYE